MVGSLRHTPLDVVEIGKAVSLGRVDQARARGDQPQHVQQYLRKVLSLGPTPAEGIVKPVQILLDVLVQDSAQSASAIDYSLTFPFIGT